MTSDFGAKSTRKKPPYVWMAVGALLLLGLIAASFVPAYFKQRNAAIAESGRWSISGPPCPALSAAEFAASGRVTPRGFTFGEVRFENQHGHASCTTLVYDGGTGRGTYPACQFMAPAVLKVTTAKGQFHFLPGLGQPATVFVENDQPRCVMAINKASF